jgi:hypothetical protein
VRRAINYKIGDKVLILCPAYVAGKIGEICGHEGLRDAASAIEPETYDSQERWLIRVENENATESLVVSLFPKDFEVFKNDFEAF